MSLGNWVLLDIETTGINPSTDEVIDIGYLQFEGTKLVRTYSSLVKPQNPVSSFITKLTGISNQQLQKAPLWTEVETELLLLESHQILAHNAAFEESFLKRYFDKLPKSSERESYHDSILYLALTFPHTNTLNLEYFIHYFGIAEKEEHRGLADSRDLLKVLLLASFITHADKELRLKLFEIFQEFSSDFFYKKFFMLTASELQEIASQLDFNLMEASQKIKSSQTSEEISSYDLKKFEKTLKKSVLH